MCILAASALLILLLPLQARAAVSAATSAKNLTLRLSDLPAGFRQETSVYKSAARVASKPLTPAELRSHGFVTQYENSFKRQTVNGISSLLTILDVFRLNANAVWGLKLSLKQENLGLKGFAIRPLALARVGDESHA